jgi:hypothetical protein
MIGVLGFNSRWRLGIFLFTTTSRKALVSTQPPIQWVPWTLSLEVKRPRRDADGSPPSSAKVKECVELYLHPYNTPSWCGAKLKKAQGQLYLFITEVETCNLKSQKISSENKRKLNLVSKV